MTDEHKIQRGKGTNSFGTCSICGYAGPGPEHTCKKTYAELLTEVAALREENEQQEKTINYLTTFLNDRHRCVKELSEENERLKKRMEKQLKVSFVGRIPKKYDYEGYAGVFVQSENHIYVDSNQKISTLVHEAGHYVIAECGGGNEEHELYDYLDCEGQSFIDFANKVETLKTDLTAALEQNRELMREICNLTATGENIFANRSLEVARERGWPDDLFEEKKR